MSALRSVTYLRLLFFQQTRCRCRADPNKRRCHRTPLSEKRAFPLRFAERGNCRRTAHPSPELLDLLIRPRMRMQKESKKTVEDNLFIFVEREVVFFVKSICRLCVGSHVCIAASAIPRFFRSKGTLFAFYFFVRL